MAKSKAKTVSLDALGAKWKKDPEFMAAYDESAPEFALAHAVIRAREQAGMTQIELAKKMNTTQAMISRIEGGNMPSTRTLQRLAEATGTNLRISFE